MVSVEMPDVNVLIALFDPAHIHHHPAQNWFATARTSGWATCPLTENGFLRVVTNPSYPNVRLTVADAGAHLRSLIDSHPQTHQFWADDISLCDLTLFNLDAVQGHRQLTDLYLLGMCQQRGAALVTFDNAIQALSPALVTPRADLIHLLIA
jgi:toxin-antitoxin system PIN domain toxin